MESATMTTERIRAAYDQIAPRFATMHGAMPGNYLEIGARFLMLAGPSLRVLDVGCGAGRDMAWLEAQGAQVIGVDLSAGMLAQARRHSGVRGPLMQMEMRALGLPSRAVSGVWCSASLLHLPKADAPAALAEMARVLRSGGVMMLSLQEGEGEGWEPGLINDVERFFARYRPAELAVMLERAGFAMHEQRSDDAGSRRWLTMLATRA
jgi:ubiquinone/menaquinone biosynthesis C-methylase UbiE